MNLQRLRRRDYGDWRMYSLGSIAKRLVRDDAKLEREFGDGYEWIYWKCLSRF